MPCPRCDAELAPTLAAAPEPACHECGQPLLPARAATAGRRLAAALVDAAVVAAVAVPVHAALAALVSPPPLLGPVRTPLGFVLELFALPAGPALVRALPSLILLYLYLALHWAGTGQTVGGRLLRIGVVDRRGAPPGPLRTLLRAVAHAGGGAAGALGWIFAVFDLERRAFHDKIAGTWVVQRGGVP